LDLVFRRLLPASEWHGPLLFLESSFRPVNPPMKLAARRKAREILGADRLAVTVEFPHRDARQKPVRVKGHLLPDTCCGKSLEALVRIPAEARPGDVEVRIVWDDAGELKGGSATVNVSLRPPR
jgi:hypothetical protein